MRRRILALLVMCLVVINAPIHAQSDEIRPRLYFQSDDSIYLIDPNYEIVLADLIATLPSNIQCSKWAVGGGEWLIIGTAAGIYRLNHDTLALEPLVEAIQFGEGVQVIADCPLVSPNGEWIGFRTSTFQPGASGTLYTMRVDGSDLQTIIPEFTFGADWRGLVEWSYDSEWMIVGAGIEDESGKWRIRPDGSGLALIDRATEAQYLGAASPDGNSVAYWTHNVPASTNRVRFLELNGTPILNLDELRIYGDAFAPVWTPDGDALIVIVRDFTYWTGEADTGRLLILQVAADGGEYEILSELPYDLNVFIGILAPTAPSWSPNREWAVILQANELIQINSGNQVELESRYDYTLGNHYLWEADSQGLWYLGGGETPTLYRFDMRSQGSTAIIDLPLAKETWVRGIGWWDQP